MKYAKVEVLYSNENMIGVGQMKDKSLLICDNKSEFKMIHVDKSVKTLLSTDCLPYFCQVIEIFLNGSSYLVLPQHQSDKAEIKLFNTITSFITTFCLTDHATIGDIAFHEETKSLYFSDYRHGTICQIDLQPFLSRLSDGCQMNAMEKTICGTRDDSGLRDGIGSNARFFFPDGIGFSTFDKNLLFVCDFRNSSIRKVDILTKQVTTVTTSLKMKHPQSIHVDRYDNLFVYDRVAHSILKVNKEGRTRTIFTSTCQWHDEGESSSFLTLDEKGNVILHCGTSVVQVTFLEAQFFRFQLSTLHRWNRLFSSFFSSPDKSNNKDNNKKVLLFLLSIEILGGVDHYQNETHEKKKTKIQKITGHAQNRTTLKNRWKNRKKKKGNALFWKYVFFSSFCSLDCIINLFSFLYYFWQIKSKRQKK